MGALATGVGTSGTIRAFVLITAVGLVSVCVGCVLMTDAATRLGEDLVWNAALLQGNSSVERAFIHHPRSWPSGCAGGYIVELQESLHHPASGGSLLIGCEGTQTFQEFGYSYSTTYHLNAVGVPKDLSAGKKAGEPIRVTLRKRKGVVEVVSME